MSTFNCAANRLDALSFLWLEITGKCNLTCSHCYADSSPTGELYGSMTHRDWLRSLDEATELGCRRVQFIGGEPTMHPRLRDLVDHANHRGFELIEVFTNATRLGADLLGCFQRNRVHVASSFYSDDPVVHEGITQSEGSWLRTVSGIRSVIAAGLPIRVGVIETSRNQGHGGRAIAFVKGLGVERVELDRQRGVGRASQVSVATDQEPYSELCGQCWKGKLCITPSGTAYPCVFARFCPVGDAREGLGKIVRSQRVTDFRTRLREDRQAIAIHGNNHLCEPSDCRPNVGCPPDEMSCNPDSGCNPD